MEGLSIREKEDLEFGEEENEVVESDQSLCLVGRFLTNRNIRIPIMRDRMAEIWRPGRGVQIDVVEEGLFAFQFFHQLDIQKVLKLGPWTFDKHLLVLGVIQIGIQPQEVPLNHVPFWVQVHGVPTGFMSEAVGKGLGNFIGQFMEYDANNSSNFWRPYMRIRVLVDVREPLRRSKSIKKKGGEAKTVTFRYERLEIFCYLCGMLGHGENDCEIRFTMGEDDGERGWGPELRAENRRTGGGGGRSRWLRDGSKGEWVSPLINAGRNPGNYSHDSSADSVKGGFQNSSEFNGGTETGGSVHMESSSSNVGRKEVNQAAIFQNPHLFFPIKSKVIDPMKSVPTKSADEMMADVVVIDSDRKRQRAHVEGTNQLDENSHAEQQHVNNSGGAKMNVNGASSNVGGVEMNVAGGASINQNSLNFLKVGLGKQANQNK